MANQKIDVQAARRLRAKGHTYREVAGILSKRIGRRPPFQTGSVSRTVAEWESAHGRKSGGTGGIDPTMNRRHGAP